MTAFLSKKEIAAALAFGGEIYSYGYHLSESDVIIKSKFKKNKKTYIKLRHRWSDDEDARVYDVILSFARQAAKQVCLKEKCDCEIWDPRGWQISTIFYEDLI
jgi:hypothetical protein